MYGEYSYGTYAPNPYASNAPKFLVVKLIEPNEPRIRSSAISATKSRLDDWMPPPHQPDMKRAKINQLAVSQNMITNQNNTAGTAKKIIARLQPMKLVIRPIVNTPHKPPRQLIDPIQDICSVVKAPVFNGDASDMSNTSAGDIHPLVQPWANVIKLAVNFSRIKSHAKSQKTVTKTHPWARHSIVCSHYEIRKLVSMDFLPFIRWLMGLGFRCVSYEFQIYCTFSLVWIESLRRRRLIKINWIWGVAVLLIWAEVGQHGVCVCCMCVCDDSLI